MSFVHVLNGGDVHYIYDNDDAESHDQWFLPSVCEQSVFEKHASRSECCKPKLVIN